MNHNMARTMGLESPLRPYPYFQNLKKKDAIYHIKDLSCSIVGLAQCHSLRLPAFGNFP